MPRVIMQICKCQYIYYMSAKAMCQWKTWRKIYYILKYEFKAEAM